ncbi:L-lactate permease [Zoogloea sp.]|uniref:L-lactate permease n=1 Tax=Zoogloea sp. TaxID=49181 RepID=UPI0025D4A94E|nr:L-lactate permease [Zoogloea sp.]
MSDTPAGGGQHHRRRRTGKMISPQSIAVACAAVGLVGKESDLFRFTVKHSLMFATMVGIITNSCRPTWCPPG